MRVLLNLLAYLHDAGFLSVEITVGIDTTDRAQWIVNEDVDVWSVEQVLTDGLGSSHCDCNGIETLLEGVKTKAVSCLVGLICSEKRLIRLGTEDASLDYGPAEAFDELAIMTASFEWLNHWRIIIGVVEGLEGADKEVDMKFHGGNSLWDGGVVNTLVGAKGTSKELCSEEVVEERDNIADSVNICELNELSRLRNVPVVNSFVGALLSI